MNQNPKQFIIQVLNIIGYENDREKYADEFLTLCLEQAIVDLTSTLTPEKQTEFKNKLSLVKSAEDIEKLLSEYSTKDEYEEALKKASQTLFQDYLKSIVPTLNEQQKNSLQQFLTSQSQ